MEIFERALIASRELPKLPPNKINRILKEIADEAVEQTEAIIKGNLEDLAAMSADDPKYDRLKLTRERIESIADEMRNVAELPSPLGKILSSVKRPNEIVINKVTAPFGVVGIIYEARPNVTFDSVALCIKSGNAVILKGGSDAQNSNLAIVKIIKKVLSENGVNSDAVTLLSAERESASQLLRAVGYVDLVIPRGSSSLIRFVRENALVPTIETGAGICHTYIDSSADTTKAAAIVNNAKTRRPSVCNSLDCMIIHQDKLSDLAQICKPLATSNVKIYADAESHAALYGIYPYLDEATEAHFGTEFLDYKMSVKTVHTLQEAFNHIARYSSKHSESIVTEDSESAKEFLTEVDAACVYHNVSTAFTDGAQFGMGAEIGISTQKLGARGPMALPELTTYKYVITGDGQIR